MDTREFNFSCYILRDLIMSYYSDIFILSARFAWGTVNAVLQLPHTRVQTPQLVLGRSGV